MIFKKRYTLYTLLWDWYFNCQNGCQIWNSFSLQAKQILDAREVKTENQGSDKENDQEELHKKTDMKTYSKTKTNVQKVLSAKNGTLSTAKPDTISSATTSDVEVIGECKNRVGTILQ